ncbi:tetratricopeptide repeat protein [Streptomyces galilaeus]|uniref:tetratricopeptide repeat protein n=1 Tax=Streptomyces galilaeus TaxID=33899 RepID=UPI0038F70971
MSVYAPNGERPVYWIGDFPVAQATISVKRARSQPARLLQARYAVVDFTGRHAELADLKAWRDSDDPVSVLLMHGAGGQGKTRLANEFARISRDDDWKVLLARHASDPSIAADHSHNQSSEGVQHKNAGILTIVDYAERWPTVDLLKLLVDATRQRIKTRVLLVARPSGVWWQTLSDDLERRDIETCELTLGALADDVDVRPETLYTVAVDRFAQALDVPGVSNLEIQPAVLTDSAFRQALTVHMAALVAVDAFRRGQHGDHDGSEAPRNPAEISAYLLARERAYWEKLHAHQRIRITADALGQTAYTAALTGPLSYADGLEALARVRVATNEPGDRSLKDHAIAYPPPIDTGGVTYLDPLYPDQLAEDFLALSVPGHGVLTYPPDPWSTDAPRRLLSNSASNSSRWARPALTGLIAAAQRWPHVITQQLTPLLTAHPQMAVQAGGAALVALANLPDLDTAILEAIEPHLPEGQHVDLAPGIAAIAYRLAYYRMARTEDMIEQAVIGTDLAERLHYAGLHDAAVHHAQDALATWRHVAATNPANNAQLATALGNLSIHLSTVGQRDEALAAAQEAVTLHRGLAQTDIAADPSGLSAALNSLSTHLGAAGRPEEAIAASQEAVAIERHLTRLDPAARQSNLASALGNLGNHLGEVGRWEEAVAAAQEAVTIHRRLAAEDPGARAPDLAAALCNLGNQLSQIGQWEKALSATREATDLYRAMSTANPAAHQPSFALALGNLGNRLAEVGQWAEALAAAQEAASLYRLLSEINPSAYEPQLALTLNNLGNRLAEAGHHEDALAASQEAATIRRRLAEAKPAAYESDLASSLGNLGNRLAMVEHHQEAVAAAQEAATKFRDLAESNPTVYEPKLATALSNLGSRLAKVERRNEALIEFQKAVTICRNLARTNPTTYGSNLAVSLWALAQGQSQWETEENLLAAFEAATESVDICQRLESIAPGAYSLILPGILATLAIILHKLGRNEEADSIVQHLFKSKESGNSRD